MRTGDKFKIPLPALWVLGLLIAILLHGFAVGVSGQTRPEEDVAASASEQTADTAPLPPNAKMSYERREVEKVKLYVSIVALSLGGFVIMLAIITLMRWWRRKLEKAQLGKKQPATEVIDAWSMHKLPEDTEEADDNSSS